MTKDHEKGTQYQHHNHQEMQIKATNTSVMITIKTKTKQVYGERGTLYTAVGNTAWYSHYRKQYEDSSEY